MGELIKTWLVPHPPIIIPAVGKGRERAARETIEGYQAMAAEVAALAPEAVVVLSPHGTVSPWFIGIPQQETLRGDLGQFGAADTAFSCPAAKALAQALLAMGQAAKLPVEDYRANRSLDHGSFLPLWFIQQQYSDFQALPVLVGGAVEDEPLRAFGRLLRQAVAASGQRVLLVVSGDLSHRLLASGPYGYAEAGMDFEKAIERLLLAGDFSRLALIDQQWRSNAGQCAMGPLLVAAGALDNRGQVTVLSHEWPFGVGYMVAGIEEVTDNVSNAG